MMLMRRWRRRRAERRGSIVIIRLRLERFIQGKYTIRYKGDSMIYGINFHIMVWQRYTIYRIHLFSLWYRIHLFSLWIRHVRWLSLKLTHWGRVTHICVSELTTIGSDNGLSPDRRQAIIWTNAGILSIGPLRTNFSEILIETQTFSSKKIRLKVSSAKWRPFRLDLNVLTYNCLHGSHLGDKGKGYKM